MPPTKVCAIRAVSPEIQSKIDELGEIRRRIALIDPDIERERILKDELDAYFCERPADEPIVERGSVYEIQMSARRNERTITDPRKAFQLLKKVLGIDGLIAAIAIPLAAVDKHVPRSAQHPFVKCEQTGYRTCKVIALREAA